MAESTGSWNDRVIAQFHAGDLRIADMFDRSALLLLHSTGARSGERRTSPLAYLTIDDRIVIVASAGGAPAHPSWYHNLLAHPEVVIERWQDDAIETLEVKAVPVEGPEYDQLWTRVAERAPGFDAYRSQTTRVIPLFVLQPR